MIVLSSYASMPDAMIVQGMLEANGIKSMVSDGNNMYVPVFGGVSLLVAEEDYENARRLLDEHDDA